jgi:hypothetical protein
MDPDDEKFLSTVWTPSKSRASRTTRKDIGTDEETYVNTELILIPASKY